MRTIHEESNRSNVDSRFPANFLLSMYQSGKEKSQSYDGIKNQKESWKEMTKGDEWKKERSGTIDGKSIKGDTKYSPPLLWQRAPFMPEL